MPSLVTLLPFVFELSSKNHGGGQNDPPTRAKVKCVGKAVLTLGGHRPSGGPGLETQLALGHKAPAPDVFRLWGGIVHYPFEGCLEPLEAGDGQSVLLVRDVGQAADVVVECSQLLWHHKEHAKMTRFSLASKLPQPHVRSVQ